MYNVRITFHTFNSIPVFMHFMPKVIAHFGQETWYQEPPKNQLYLDVHETNAYYQIYQTYTTILTAKNLTYICTIFKHNHKMYIHHTTPSVWNYRWKKNSKSSHPSSISFKTCSNNHFFAPIHLYWTSPLCVS